MKLLITNTKEDMLNMLNLPYCYKEDSFILIILVFRKEFFFFKKKEEEAGC